MAKKQEIDLDRWGEIKTHAEDLKSMYQARNQNNDSFDDMYLMDWTEPTDTGMSLAKTISPDARNAVHGAVRLMVAADPLFNVPGDKSKRGENDEKIEKAAAYIWDMAGRVHGAPIHYDSILSSLLYGEQHIAITDTNAMVENAKQIKQSKAYIARAEQVASRTPFTLDVWSPQDGYPEEDNFGLVAYLRSTKVKAGEIRSRFGAAAFDMLASKSSSDEVDLSIWYDLEYYAVAIDDTPVICTPHDLIAIPISVTLSDGSKLFSKPEHQRQPFLYTLLKSGMWNRQNLSLTVLYSLIESMLLLPQIIHSTPRSNPDKSLVIDYSTAGSHVQVDAADGEKVEVFDKSRIIDPSLNIGLQMADQKVMESTIQKTALGAPLGSGTAFSTYSLLAQSGRIPLIAVQKRAGWGIAEAMEIALRLYKDGGKAHPALDIKPSEIPDTIQLEANLDIALPQDKLQLANIAKMLTSGDNPLTDKEWARENILNINQSREMDANIWSERAADVQYQAWLQQQIQQAQMQMQQNAMGAQQGGMPQGMQPQQGMPPQQGLPPGMTPEMLQQMMGGQSQGMSAGAMMPPGQADMVQGGLPPEMAGMIPGQGQATVPPEMAGMMGGD